jgi:hypothetical protein
VPDAELDRPRELGFDRVWLHRRGRPGASLQQFDDGGCRHPAAIHATGSGLGY